MFSLIVRNTRKVKCLLLLSSSFTEEPVCTGTKMNRRSRMLYASELFFLFRFITPFALRLDMKEIKLKNQCLCPSSRQFKSANAIAVKARSTARKRMCQSDKWYPLLKITPHFDLRPWVLSVELRHQAFK